jgi:hypothetical protein
MDHNMPRQPTQVPSHLRREPPMPLTHHEILRLVEPFSRRGYRVDLERSDRAARRIAFQVTELAADPDVHPAMRCAMTLEVPAAAGRPMRLVRTLTSGIDAHATATVEGTEASALLEALQTLPPAQQIRIAPGLVLSRSYRFSDPQHRRTDEARAAVPRLVSAEVRVDDRLTLRFGIEARTVVHPVEVELPRTPPVTLPEDFLAVAGWHWRTLQPVTEQRWRAGVRLPDAEPARTAALERAIDQAVTHCRTSFGDEPAAFHRRHARTRWLVMLRRLAPLCVAATATAAFVVLALALPKTPAVHMALSQVPILAIVAAALLRERPRLEIPPLPAPLPRSAWMPWRIESAARVPARGSAPRRSPAEAPTGREPVHQTYDQRPSDPAGDARRSR